MIEPGKWERVRTDAGWHLRLKGANGETVVTSEVYNDASTVTEAMHIVMRAVDFGSFSDNISLIDIDERSQS